MRLWHEDLIAKLPRPQLLASYRGKVCPPYTEVVTCAWKRPLYKEHDDAYYKECVENLAQKGIVLGGE